MYRSRPVSAFPNTNTLANGWVRVCITIIPSVHVFNGTAEIALLLLLLLIAAVLASPAAVAAATANEDL